MCGIAGFELRGDNEQTTAHLLRRLARRGPDAAWFARVVPYGFVQTRLSVIDLSERVQYPLRSESGALHLLFNGEIYEQEQHRSALERRGHRFATACDAEVVIHGYEEWGIEVLSRLDGMFALALFHRPSRELVLARDSLGIKPLVHTTKGRFAFSSDALSLVAAGLSDGVIDERMLEEYFAFHYLAPPGTGICDLQQLGPGEVLRRSGDGNSTIERWAARPFSAPAASSPVIAEDVEGALDRSVQRQLVADVPVGVFLSSGLDSSLVLDSAVRCGARPTAFTIGFSGHSDYDEVPAAARFASELGIPHAVAELSTGFCEAVESVSAACDQPLGDASTIATLALATLAREHVTVALSGTGGDDLFAGYYRHRAHLLAPLLARVPTPISDLLARLPRDRGGERRSLLTLARAYLSRLAAARGSDPFLQYLQLAGSASSERTAEVLSASTRFPTEPGGFAQRPGAPTSATAGSILRAIQAFELQTYLPGDLLAKEDRATMAIGLEARVPLLGAELVELAERASDEQKIGLFSGKRLLRDLARRRLPGYITRSRKRGFAVPLADLFAGVWRAEAIEWFANSGSTLVDGRAASKLLRGAVLQGPDAWALAALIGWETSVREASREAASGIASLRTSFSVVKPGSSGGVRPPKPEDLLVVAQTAYPDVAAGSRVRVVEMGTHLKRLGVHVNVAPSMTNDQYSLIASSGVSSAKAIGVARGIARLPHRARHANDTLTLVHRLRTLMPSLGDRDPLDVYDFDDALFVGSAMAHHVHLGWLKREATRSVRYMSEARLVMAGNRVLADFARSYAARVEVVPSCVDPRLQETRAHEEVPVLTLGWIGSSTTSPYLAPVLDVVGSLHERGRPIRLVLMGANGSLRAPWIEHRPWSLEAEREMLTEIDVGLMPLPDDPWTRGKCGYKLLRYFSAGLPAIASPVGLNADLIGAGRGFSATTPAEWLKAIEEAGGDVELRRQMGEDSRRFVEREYSYQVWAPRVAGLLRELTR